MTAGGFSFAVPITGGMHHALHLVPLAVALDRRGHDVRLFTMDEPTHRFVNRMLEAYAPTRVVVEPLVAGPIERTIGTVKGRRIPAKSLRLMENHARLAHVDAIVAAERTTSFLRRLRLSKRRMIHVPHGAGDRAGGYERRIALYDFHIVAGPKDRARYVEAGLAEADRIAVCGYIKFAGVDRLHSNAERLFANGNPVVLYNPHFDPRLGSFDKVGRALIDAFAARPDLNFIVAPHINLARRLSPHRCAAIRGAAADNVLLDFGSERSCDMTYTRAADIYLGDVSSQIYEYVRRPRPAVFIDVAGADWRHDPHFAMWNMGAVVAPDVGAIMAALDEAPMRQPEFCAAQAALALDALGPAPHDAPERAADAVLAFMASRRRT